LSSQANSLHYFRPARVLEEFVRQSDLIQRGVNLSCPHVLSHPGPNATNFDTVFNGDYETVLRGQINH
jgi:hypothetical protein